MKLKIGQKFALFFICALLVVGAAYCPPARALEQAPDFTLKSTTGTMVSLSQFKGKLPVLLEFFATWCPHCQEMAPELAKMRKSIPDSQLAILAIDVGSRDSFEKVKRYTEDNHFPFTVLFDEGSKVSQSYGIVGIPYVTLLDKNGAIKYQGYDLPSDVMSLLKPGK
jgi:peroxiredoxin